MKVWHDCACKLHCAKYVMQKGQNKVLGALCKKNPAWIYIILHKYSNFFLTLSYSWRFIFDLSPWVPTNKFCMLFLSFVRLHSVTLFDELDWSAQSTVSFFILRLLRRTVTVTLMTMFDWNGICLATFHEGPCTMHLDEHNGAGMFGMNYLNCWLTRRLQFSLISISTPKRGI